eukprot:scaffold7279_cov175-Amphora_coffeaeformis.AAC.2
MNSSPKIVVPQRKIQQQQQQQQRQQRETSSSNPIFEIIIFIPIHSFPYSPPMTTTSTNHNKNLILLNSETDALTVSWTEAPNAVRYVLQYRRAADADDQFITLSETLTSTQARKKNLSNDASDAADEDDANTTTTTTTTRGFYFRVAAVTNDKDPQPPQDWVTHPEPFQLLTGDEASTRMSAPIAVVSGSPYAAIVRWNKYSNNNNKPDTFKYEIQMRENIGGNPWETIAASFAHTEVKKKNLTSPAGYQFRVRPVAGATSDTVATSTATLFSPPSDPFVGLGLSAGLKRLFQSLEQGTLLQKSDDGKSSRPITLEEALGGKEFVLLYASAHWCGPCRSFTPMLAKWYQSLGKTNKTVEVVFLSADHDPSSFQSYYGGEMPWLAVDFDEDTREELMAWIKVTGIPRLCVLDARTGRIIEDNAVGKPLDIQRWRSLVAPAAGK